MGRIYGFNPKKDITRDQKKVKGNIGTRILISVFLIIGVYFILWNLIHRDDPDYQDRIAGVDTELDMESYSYHYSQLSSAQKYVYQSIYTACKKYQPEIFMNDSSLPDCIRALNAFRCDHPEFFWVEDATCWSQDDGVHKITLSVPDDVKGQQIAVEAAADAMLRDLPDDQFGKAKTIYERIIKSTDYHKGTPHEQDVRSVLLSHMSVCGGYSKTFLYLCDRAGVPCGYVEGDIPGRGLHAWNFVLIDGTYYWVDVTWGDPTYEYFVPNSPDISYDMLCVDDSTMLQGRLLSNNPECSIYDENKVFKYPTCKKRLNW